jgi:hypothetical protein
VRHSDADRAAAGGRAGAAASRATLARRGDRTRTAATWHTATGAGTEDMAKSQTATDTARAMAGSERVAVASRGGCRCPCLATWPWATVDMIAGKRRAAAGSGSDSASARAVVARHAAAVAAAVVDTAGGCSAGGPWWAASPREGVRRLDGFIGASSGNGSFQQVRLGDDSGVDGAVAREAVGCARGYL